MINYQRLFEVYRKLSNSFEAYFRIVLFHRKIKGFNRLEHDMINIDRKTTLIPKKTNKS